MTSVAVGCQALPVNPFLEVQLWGAARRPGLFGGLRAVTVLKSKPLHNVFSVPDGICTSDWEMVR